MKVKEAKLIKMKCHKYFRRREYTDLERNAFCEILRKNGISYQHVESCAFKDPGVEFYATFQELANLSEKLEIEFEGISIYI